MSYKESEVLDIIRSVSNQDAEEALFHWNVRQANVPLDLSDYTYPIFVYSFPVIIDGKKVATITLSRDNQSDNLNRIKKYLGYENFIFTYEAFSHDTYMYCYFTIHEEFELPNVCEGLGKITQSVVDVDGNEFEYTMTIGYPSKERDISHSINSYKDVYRFDNEVSLLVDYIKSGWLLGDRINKNIAERIKH